MSLETHRYSLTCSLQSFPGDESSGIYWGSNWLAVWHFCLLVGEGPNAIESEICDLLECAGWVGVRRGYTDATLVGAPREPRRAAHGGWRLKFIQNKAKQAVKLGIAESWRLLVGSLQWSKPVKKGLPPSRDRAKGRETRSRGLPRETAEELGLRHIPGGETNIQSKIQRKIAEREGG